MNFPMTIYTVETRVDSLYASAGTFDTRPEAEAAEYLFNFKHKKQKKDFEVKVVERTCRSELEYHHYHNHWG